MHECSNKRKDTTSNKDVVQVATSSNTEQGTCHNNDNPVCMSVKVDEFNDMSMGK